MPEDAGRRITIRAGDVMIDGQLNDSQTADPRLMSINSGTCRARRSKP